MARTQCLAATLAVCVVTVSAVAQKGAPELPAPIRSALERNAAALSPITIEVLQRFESPVPWDQTAARIKFRPPPTLELYFADRVQHWSWQDGMLYSKTTYPAFRTNSMESSFDGRIKYVGRPDVELPSGERQPSLLKSNPVSLDPNNVYIRVEYFDSAGFQLPVRGGEMGRVTEAQSRVLGAIREGGKVLRVGAVELDGVPVTRLDIAYINPDRKHAEEIDLEALESQLRNGFNAEEYVQRELAAWRRMRDLPERRLYSFFLDPVLGYAARRIDDGYDDGRLLTRVINDDFEELDGQGLWLPRYSRTDFHSWPGLAEIGTPEPVLSRIFERKIADGSPVPLEQFSIMYTEPGSIIADDTITDTQIQVRVPADTKEPKPTGRASKPSGSTASESSTDAGAGPGGDADKSRTAGSSGSAAGVTPDAQGGEASGRRTYLLLSLGAIAAIAATGLIVWRLKRR